MAFTKEQLQKFAQLIRIEIPDEKLADMKIDSVIEWIDKLQRIDTKGAAPMLTAAEGDAPMREDAVADGGIRGAVLANVPDDAGKSRGYFAVPKVMDE
jgi:aspartyl-tRNA(Asn)/glutamyl-tRNA(Gln) amidotransferase subunit C